MIDLDNFKQEERTIPFSKVHIYGMLYPAPFVALFAFSYHIIWGNNGVKSPSPTYYVWAVLVVILGIVIHELIHGLTWALFTKEGMKSMKFGVTSFTPYCHCKEPLSVKEYMLGGVMPAVILGFIPAIIALFVGNNALLWLSMFFIYAAGGDFMMLDILRKLPKDNLIIDHPTKVGFYVYVPLNGENTPSV